MAGRSRTGWWLAGVLTLVATGLWVAALLRVREQVAARPAPEGFLTWVTPDGPLGHHPSFPHCAGAAIVTTDRAWRTCYLGYSSDPDRHYVVRFELDRKRAVMLPLPDGVTATWTTAAAVSPDGELALVLDGQLIGIDGDHVAVLGSVSDHEVLGIAWVDGAVEVVQGWSAPELRRFGDAPSRRALPMPPTAPGGSHLARATLAWRDARRWNLVFELRDVMPHPAHPGEVDLLAGDERGETWTTTRVAKNPADDPPEIETTQGGLMMWHSPDWRFYQVRDGSGWKPFVHPTPEQAGEHDQLIADYRIGADGLTAMHRLDELSHAAVETPDGWLGLGYEYDGTDSSLYLHDLAGHRGPRAVRWGWVDQRAVLVPASAGGWWLLGAFATYIRVDGLRRVDEPGALGRFRALSDSLDQLGRYNDWYGESVGQKRAAFPIVLLGWPVAALAALLSWLLLRRRGVRLSTPLSITMAIYGAVALALIKMFWDVTGRM